MARIGSLTADLRLQSAAFIRDLAKSSQAVASNTARMRASMRQVEAASKNVERQFGQLRGAAVALAGALAVRQFTAFAKSAIEAADSIAKQSKQLNLAASELQRYRIEGQLAGVATEKLESGIGAFAKRVGELRAGTGTLVTILDKSNVALKNQLLAAESTGAALDTLFAAIRAAPTQFDKLALSAAAFGRQAGQAMVLLAEEAGTLSGRMVELVTRSDAVLAAAERLDDQMTLLQAAFSAGFDSAIITELAASFDATVGAMTAARETGEQLGRAVGQALAAVAAAAEFAAAHLDAIKAVLAGLIAFKAAAIFLGMAQSVLGLVAELKTAATAGAALNVVMAANPFGLIAAAIGASVAALVYYADETFTVGQTTVQVGKVLNAVWTTIRESVVGLVRSVLDLGRAVSLVLQLKFGAALDQLQAGADNLGDSYREIVEAWSDLGPAVHAAAADSKAAAMGFDEAGAAAAASASAIEKATDKYKRQAVATRSLIDALKISQEAYEDQKEVVEIANEAYELGVDLTTKQGQAWKDAAFDARDLARELKDLEDAQKAAADAAKKHAEEQQRLAERQQEMMLEPFKNALRGIQDSFSDAFENILSGGVNSFADLASTVKRIFIRLAAEVATLLVFKPVVAGVLQQFGLGGLSQQLGTDGNAGGNNILGGGGGFNLGSVINTGRSIGQIFGLGASSVGSAASISADLGFGASFEGIAAAQSGASSGGFLSGIFGGGSGAAAGGASAATSWLPWVALAIAGKSITNQITGDPNIGRGIFGPSIEEIVENPKRGLLTAVGLPFLSAFGIGEDLPPKDFADAYLSVIGGQAVASSSAGIGIANDSGGGLSQTRAAIDAAVATINQLAGLAGVGLNDGTNAGRVGIARGEINFGSGSSSTGAGSLEEAVQGVVVRVLKNRSADLAPAFRAALDQASSVDEIEQSFKALAALRDEILGLGAASNPLADALKAVNDKFDALALSAQSLNVSTAQVEAARQRALEAAKLQFRAPYLAAAESIAGFLRTAETQFASPAEQIRAAQRQFGTLLGAVRGGDVSQTQNLLSTANALIGFSRSQYASSVDFQNVDKFVRSNLASLGETLASDQFFNAQVAATQQQTEVLSDGLQSVKAEIVNLQTELRQLRRAIVERAA